MDNKINLRLFNEKDSSLNIKDYTLVDASNTDTPIGIVEKFKKDTSRYPVAIIEENKVVGFFCLHRFEGPEEYGFNGNKSILIRGFSIDDRYRRNGYAGKALSQLDNFITSNISKNIEVIVLAVNLENVKAINAYSKSGYVDTTYRLQGKKGMLAIMKKFVL